MQIRLGNRQDEPAIRDLAFEVMEEFGLAPDPAGAESDLRNVEGSYFWHDGVFLVAEEEGELVGLAGARAACGDRLELVRFAVAEPWRRRGVARKLLDTIVRFGHDMGYQRLQVEPARQYPGSEAVLMKMGFTSEGGEDAQQVWFLPLSSTSAICGA